MGPLVLRIPGMVNGAKTNGGGTLSTTGYSEYHAKKHGVDGAKTTWGQGRQNKMAEGTLSTTGYSEYHVGTLSTRVAILCLLTLFEVQNQKTIL